jgi:cytosine/adenosine deaminase-related metal-dependent hydrolase
MLAAGVNVCLGTDSLASNPDLNLWREVCFVRERYPRFDGEELVRMATLRGARALGIDQMTGSITPGKRADLVVLPLPRGSRRWTDVLSCTDPPREVLQHGRVVDLDPASAPEPSWRAKSRM